MLCDIYPMIMDQLHQILQSNQLIGAIASGGLVVWIISNLKNIYYTVRNLLVSLFSFSINNVTEDVGHEAHYDAGKRFRIPLAREKQPRKRKKTF